MFIVKSNLSLTFSLAALVELLLLAVLQLRWGLRVRRGAVSRGSSHQLLWTAAALQAIFTAIGRSNSLRRDHHSLTLPTEGAPTGAQSLTHSTTWNHWVILPVREKNYCQQSC